MEGRVFQVFFGLCGLAIAGWLFGSMLWSIDWDTYTYGAPFVRVGILAEAGFCIFILCGVVFLAYKLLVRD